MGLNTGDESEKKEIHSLSDIGQLLKVPAKAPAFNFYRYSKGDLESYGETGGRVKDETILQELIDKGFLEEYHRLAAATVMEMRAVMLCRLTYKLNSIMVFCKEETGEVTLSIALDMLDMVTRDIKLSRLKIIEHACTSPHFDDYACKTIAGINIYRECFEMLIEALQSAWKKEKAAKRV